MILEQTELKPWQESLIWLNLIWPQRNGLLALAVQSGDHLKQRWFAPDEDDVLAKQLVREADNANCWLSCASFSSDSRKSDNAIEIPGLYLDIDLAGIHRSNAGFEPTVDLPTESEAMAALAAMPLNPSVVVNSGGGFYAWWIFRQPVTIEDRPELKRLLKAWQQLLRDRLPRGKHLDSTADLARILRLPGMINLKYGTRVRFHEPSLTGDTFAEVQQNLTRNVQKYDFQIFADAIPIKTVSTRVEPTYESEDIRKAYDALDGLNSERADTYDTWIKVGICLKALHQPDGFKRWSDWGRQSEKFDESDIETYRKKWESFDPDEEISAVAALIAMANEDSQPTVSTRRKYQPFPVEALPEPFAARVMNVAESTQVAPAMIAVPLLSCLAAAVGGNRFRLEVKRGWTEPPVIWTVVSAESGTGKSPAFEASMDALTRIQTDAFREYGDSKKRFDVLKSEYDRQFGQWKRAKGEKPQPEPPDTPRCWRVKIDNSTTEAVVDRLYENPRGLLVASEELSGFFGSFDRYASGSGDESMWLRCYDGRDITSDRKTGDRPVIHIPRAAVSITGTIQPGILRKHLSQEKIESGLAARFLICEPPEVERSGWSDIECDPSLREACFRKLEIVCDRREKDDEPTVVPLSACGRDAMIAWSNTIHTLQIQSHGALRAAYSKIKSIPARLGLIFHVIRTEGSVSQVTGPDIEAGVAIAEFFINEVERCYPTLRETEEDRQIRKVVDWIEQRDGETTVRELHRSRRRSLSVSGAKDLLDELVNLDYGRWEPRQERTGPAKQVFVLTSGDR